MFFSTRMSLLAIYAFWSLEGVRFFPNDEYSLFEVEQIKTCTWLHLFYLLLKIDMKYGDTVEILLNYKFFLPSKL